MTPFNFAANDEEECTDESSKFESSGSSENETFEILKSLIKSKKKTKKSRSHHAHSHKSMPAYSNPSIPSPSMAMYPPYYPYPQPFHQNPQQLHIEELHQTLLKQIEYNKHRKHKRKRKRIVKKQQNTAASTIQKAWKKYKTVAKWTDPMMTKGIEDLLSSNELANQYLDELISEYFFTEFVPDLLIEILSNENDDEFYQKDVVTKVAWEFYEQIEKDVCTAISTQMCNETIDEIVSQYFERNKGGIHLKGILHHINNETVNEVVLHETKHLVEECIEELIIEYLIECKSMELYNSLLPEIIEKNVNETLILHILQEDVLDKLLKNGYLDQMIEEIANEEYEKQKKQIVQEKTNEEHDLIEGIIVTQLLNEEMLNILINKLTTRSSKQHINDQAIKVLVHSEMSSMLIKKHVNLDRVHGRTKENVIVNEQLMNMLCESALPHFLDYLKQ